MYQTKNLDLEYIKKTKNSVRQITQFKNGQMFKWILHQKIYRDVISAPKKMSYIYH